MVERGREKWGRGVEKRGKGVMLEIEINLRDRVFYGYLFFKSY